MKENSFHIRTLIKRKYEDTVIYYVMIVVISGSHPYAPCITAEIPVYYQDYQSRHTNVEVLFIALQISIDIELEQKIFEK